MPKELTYDKNIWFDPSYRLIEVIKIIKLEQFEKKQNKPIFVCFLEDMGELSLKQIKTTICSLKYYDFLKTPYWQIIASQVKYEKDMVCELCGKRFNKMQFLDVHHKDYKIHGEEHLCLDELVCLCDFCHKNIHNIV